MSLKTLRTSLNSMFRSSFRSPSGFLATRTPSSTIKAREETRESNTNRSSAEVGLRVGSFSELKKWIKLRCWYWTYRKKDGCYQAKLAVVAKRRETCTSPHFISSTPSRLAQLISEASISRSWKLRSRRNAAVGLFCINCTTSLIWGLWLCLA